MHFVFPSHLPLGVSLPPLNLSDYVYIYCNVAFQRSFDGWVDLGISVPLTGRLGLSKSKKSFVSRRIPGLYIYICPFLLGTSLSSSCKSTLQRYLVRTFLFLMTMSLRAPPACVIFLLTPPLYEIHKTHRISSPVTGFFFSETQL